MSSWLPAIGVNWYPQKKHELSEKPDPPISCRGHGSGVATTSWRTAHGRALSFCDGRLIEYGVGPNQLLSRICFLLFNLNLVYLMFHMLELYYIHIYRGFPNTGGNPESSMIFSDFPWNKPSSYWGSPILTKKCLLQGNFIPVLQHRTSGQITFLS